MEINQLFKFLLMITLSASFLTACQSTGTVDKSVTGLKKCESEGELAFQYAVTKPFILETFAQNPKEGKADEAWRFLALIIDDDKKYSGISQDTKMAIAKSVTATNLSDDFKVDAFLFREYYKLSCNNKANGSSTYALQEIDSNEILSCWDNRNGSVTLNACMFQLASKP